MPTSDTCIAGAARPAHQWRPYCGATAHVTQAQLQARQLGSRAIARNRATHSGLLSSGGGGDCCPSGTACVWKRAQAERQSQDHERHGKAPPSSAGLARGEACRRAATEPTVAVGHAAVYLSARPQSRVILRRKRPRAGQRRRGETRNCFRPARRRQKWDFGSLYWVGTKGDRATGTPEQGVAKRTPNEKLKARPCGGWGFVLGTRHMMIQKNPPQDHAPLIRRESSSVTVAQN